MIATLMPPLPMQAALVALAMLFAPLPGATLSASPMRSVPRSALVGPQLEPPSAVIPVRKKGAPATQAAPPAAAAPIVAAPVAPPPPPPPPAEGIEVDVSTRTVAITSVFSGTEIVVFGAVDNSRQQSAESGYYDLVVVVEGASAPAIIRQKSRLPNFGIWVNTDEMRFDLPLYRAIASTKPIEEIAEARQLTINGISFDKVFLSNDSTRPDRAVFQEAVLRLKTRDKLYVREDFGVAFIGRSLFRAGVKLPANIPVGPLDVRVILFKDGRVLASRTATVRLERQGMERLIYDFAYEHSVWYGLLAVMMAAGAGLVASAAFQRQQG